MEVINQERKYPIGNNIYKSVNSINGLKEYLHYLITIEDFKQAAQVRDEIKEREQTGRNQWITFTQIKLTIIPRLS